MDNNVPPILLVIFNRPEKTLKVFDELKKIKPARLFISADGPRADHPEEADKCQQVRDVATDIDWPCEVKTRFLDENYGCGPAVSSAIDWFFEHVDRGIILEDDCVPHPHFFQFCNELLSRYSEDNRIMSISGFAPQPERVYPYDYHFSKKFWCSGWATWRRAWKHFIYDINKIDESQWISAITSYYEFKFDRREIMLNFRKVQSGRKVWAFRWELACYIQNGLTIVPERNLVTNIGFDLEGTHTKDEHPVLSNLKTKSLSFPLRHPPFIHVDRVPEIELRKTLHRMLPFKSRCARHLRHLMDSVSDFWRTIP